MHDSHALLWALTGRVQPHRDITILPAGPFCLWISRSCRLRPTASPPSPPSRASRDRSPSSTLAGAWAYPPVSLPPEPILARARTLWQELGLPELPAPTGPTHGYSLGNWSERDADEAAAAQAGVFLAADRTREQERTALPPESASPGRGPPRALQRGGPAPS